MILQKFQVLNQTEQKLSADNTHLILIYNSVLEKAFHSMSFARLSCRTNGPSVLIYSCSLTHLEFTLEKMQLRVKN